MKRRNWLLLAIGSPLGAQPVAEGKPRKKVPEFKARSLDGTLFDSQALQGKVVLIQIWATWCKFCKRDEPAVETILRDHARDGLVVLAVNQNESRVTVEKYLRESPRSVKVVLAKDFSLAAGMSEVGLPAYLLIDRHGYVAGTQEGSGGLLALRGLLEEAGLRKG